MLVLGLFGSLFLSLLPSGPLFCRCTGLIALAPAATTLLPSASVFLESTGVTVCSSAILAGELPHQSDALLEDIFQLCGFITTHVGLKHDIPLQVIVVNAFHEDVGETSPIRHINGSISFFEGE
jgi:hypothetical protein